MGASHISPLYFCILIDVQNDSEKEMLRRDKTLEESMRDALLGARYPTEAARSVGFSIESQQTVDRDFAGSWFYARK
jgi:hypothetical protein